MSSKNIPLINLLQRTVKSRAGQLFIYFGLIPLLLLAVLLLPPLSLMDRLLSIGYEPIEAGGGVIQGPEGVQVKVWPDGISGPAWLKLEAVPTTLLVERSASPEFLAAVEKVPPNLTIKSALYRFSYRGAAPAAVDLIIPLPAEASPAHPLDLYTWNGQAWEWWPYRKVR